MLGYGFLLAVYSNCGRMYSFEISSVNEWRDVENLVQGH